MICGWNAVSGQAQSPYVKGGIRADDSFAGHSVSEVSLLSLSQMANLGNFLRFSRTRADLHPDLRLQLLPVLLQLALVLRHLDR